MTALLLVGIVTFFFFPPPASAYLDPGSGNLLFQVMAASFISLIYLIKKYWAKITSFLHHSHDSLTPSDRR